MKASADGAARKAAAPAAGNAVDVPPVKDAPPLKARAARPSRSTAAPPIDSPPAAPLPQVSAAKSTKPPPETAPKVTKTIPPTTIAEIPAEPQVTESVAPPVAAVIAAPEPAAAPVAVPEPVAVEPPRQATRPPESRPGHMTMVNGRPVPPSRAAAKEENFVSGDFVVYPTHGVGKVEKIAVEEIAGHKLELIHITFEENRMMLRVPVAKARSAGLRKLASRKMFDEALAVLKGRARVKRTMWSRRAQEYEAKINSGDPIAIAEVVRDLHRNSGQPDQSFSERQIYEAALDRLAAELAALDETDKMTAIIKLGNFLKAA